MSSNKAHNPVYTLGPFIPTLLIFFFFLKHITDFKFKFRLQLNSKQMKKWRHLFEPIQDK